MKDRRIVSIVIGIAAAALFISSPLLRADADIVLGCVLLFALSLGPAIRWLALGMKGMPLFEMFAGMHLLYYWMGFGRHYEAGVDGRAFDSKPIWVVCAFLTSGMFAYYGATRWRLTWRSGPGQWLSAEVGGMRQLLWFWLMVAFSVGFEFAVQTGQVWQFVSWSGFRSIQTVFSALAMVGVFRLSMELGIAAMSRTGRVAYFGILAVLVMLQVVSGFLGMAGVILTVAGFGYMLGARRVPLVAFGLCLCLGSFLNLGKKEWRETYWEQAGVANIMIRAESLLRFSWTALERRLTLGEMNAGAAATLVERASLGEVLDRVVSLTPRTVPFANGDSYARGFALVFVPSSLQERIGDFNSSMTEASLTYGFFYSIEQAAGTNISLGPIAEAWMNGGWGVVLLVGAWFGLFFAVGNMMAWGQSFNSVGYLSGVFFFSTLNNSMELFVGASSMSFSRAYPVALFILMALAAVWRLNRSGANPRPTSSWLAQPPRTS